MHAQLNLGLLYALRYDARIVRDLSALWLFFSLFHYLQASENALKGPACSGLKRFLSAVRIGQAFWCQARSVLGWDS